SLFVLSFSIAHLGRPRDLHSFPTRRSSDLGTLAISCLVMVTGGFGRAIFLSHWPLVVIFTFIMAGFRPACLWGLVGLGLWLAGIDRKSTRLNSSHVKISYAVFCLKKKKE